MLYTILFAILLVAVPLMLIKVMTTMHRRKQKRLTSGRYLQFKQIASQHHLHLSEIEMIKDQLLGIDGFKGKLLVACTNGSEHLVWEIIDLYSISESSMYNIKGLNQQTQHYKPSLHTKELGLRLHFYYDRGPLDIVFYQHIVDYIHQLPKAESAARKWERILAEHIKVVRPTLAVQG